MTALVAGAGRGRASAQPAGAYPDWIAASTKPAKRGGVLTRASAWDPPMIDPRLTQSVGLYQFAGLTSNRLVRYAFTDEATGTNDLEPQGRPRRVLAGEPGPTACGRSRSARASSGRTCRRSTGASSPPPTSSTASRPTRRRACRRSRSRKSRGWRRPTSTPLRVHLKTPNALFPQNLAEPVAVIFSKEVLEEDGDLKKRMIGTGPYIAQGAHPQGAGGARSATPTTSTRAARTSTSTSSSRRRTTPPAWRRSAPGRATSSGGRAVATWRPSARPTPTAVVQAYQNTLAPFGLALAQDRAALQRRAGAARHLDGHRPPEAGRHGLRGPRDPGLGRALHLLPGQDADAEGARPVVAVPTGRGQEAPGRGRPSATASRRRCSTTSTSRR